MRYGGHPGWGRTADPGGRADTPAGGGQAETPAGAMPQATGGHTHIHACAMGEGG